eukprot:3133872-Ditylum_brightwellii.AAC.1
MQAQFDKMTDMLSQHINQQDEMNDALSDLVRVFKSRHNNSDTFTPLPTASQYQFAAAIITCRGEGGPEPWLDHEVPWLYSTLELCRTYLL